MKDSDKSKEQLLNELKELRQRLSESLKSTQKSSAATANLENEKSRAEAIIEAIGDGICIQDAAFNILYQNRAHKELFGDHASEVCYKAFRQGDNTCAECPLAMSFKDGKIHTVERHMASNKGDTYFSVTSSSMRDSSGQVIAGIQVIRNITKRKLAEQALKDSGKKYRDLVDNALVGVYKTNTKGDILFANNALSQMLEFDSPEDMMKQNAASMYKYPERRKVLIEALSKNNTVNGFEIEMLTKTGKSRHVLLSSVRDGDTLTGMIMDITERKQAEEERERLVTAISSSTNGIAITDKNDRYVYVNDAHAKIYGYKPGELIGKTWMDIVPPEKIMEAKNGLQVTLHNKNVGLFNKDTAALRKNGTIILTEVKAKALWDKNGNYQGHICIVTDITERKKAEEALRESEEKFRTLAEKLPNMIFINQKGAVKYANEKCEEIMGYTREEFYSPDFNFISMIAPEYKEVAMDNFKKHMQGIEVEPYEYALIAKNGKTIDTIITTKLITYEGGSAILGIITDISERKRMERELLKTQKLESLGILAGGIAHDFNNVLAAITGNLSLAKMYTKPGMEVFDMLTEAEKAASRAKNLAMQLLTFSKGGTPVKTLTSITKLVKDAAEFALSGSTVKCELTAFDNTWPVEIDRGQISQVIHNLAINAQQAMPEGGIIELRIRNIVADAETPALAEGKRYVKISIKDRGIGISEEHISKIFDPYFTTKHEGSGLGLATAYSIVTKHNGHITAESRLGFGTTFNIYLPASEAEIQENTAAGKLIAKRGSGKVLVMDDDEIVRLVVGRMLGQCGYDAEFAEDGEQAINLYKAAKDSGHPFAAVIIDLIIPAGMGGKEAIRKLIEIDPDIKAIVSSGYSDDPVMSNYRDYGFKGSLAKPYEIIDLGRMLQQVISGTD